MVLTRRVCDLRQLHPVGKHRSPLHRHQPEVRVLTAVGMVEGELGTRYTQCGASDRVRQPVRIVFEAQVAGADTEAVAKESPQPAVVIAASLGEYATDSERRRGMLRWEGAAAALEPFVRITRLVRSFAPYDELRGVRGETAEGRGLEH